MLPTSSLRARYAEPVAADSAFDRRERYLREVARVLDPAVGVFVVPSVCGADVVSLLGDAVANRCAEATAGATRPPAGDPNSGGGGMGRQ